MQIAGRLETRATGSYTHQDSCSVECASWLLRIPLWPKANCIILRPFQFFLWSSRSGLPTSFCYHYLFTFTAPNLGSTNNSARWEWKRIEQNNGRFIQYITRWDPTTTQTPPTSPRRCKCSNRKYVAGHTVKNCVSNQKQAESQPPREWMLV